MGKVTSDISTACATRARKVDAVGNCSLMYQRPRGRSGRLLRRHDEQA